MIRFTLMAMAIVLTGLAVFSIQDEALAHGGASVAVAPTSVAAGASITVKIVGYQPNTLVSVTLEGVGGSIALGSLTTDAAGAGTLVVTTPADLKAGGYSVKAVGGDDSETTDLSVTSGGTLGQTGSANQMTGGGGLTYKQPTAQWVGIAVAAAIVGLAGFALVLKKE